MDNRISASFFNFILVERLFFQEKLGTCLKLSNSLDVREVFVLVLSLQVETFTHLSFLPIFLGLLTTAN
jgi:hypothetical protein